MAVRQNATGTGCVLSQESRDALILVRYGLLRLALPGLSRHASHYLISEVGQEFGVSERD